MMRLCLLFAAHIHPLSLVSVLAFVLILAGLKP
jgi:hypothetical protein